MLKILFDKGYLDYKNLILDNLKKLGLTPDEGIVFIKILDGFPNKKTISISTLLENITIDQKKLEAILASLMERKFYDLYISYDNGVGEEFISLDPFFNKLENLFSNNIMDDDYNDEIYLANKILTEGFSRTLTSNELEIVTALITDEKYTSDDIKNALEELMVSKRNLNMKSIVSFLNKNRNSTTPKNKEVSQSPMIKDFFSRMK